MLDVHKNALEGGSPVYHEFLLKYKSDSKKIYAIVEGKDDPFFYRGLIEAQINREWSIDFLSAGNRDRVIKSIDNFDWSRFSSNRICFFIDRDLSDFIPNHLPIKDNLYITDNYSIENEAINLCVVNRILDEVFNISNISTIEEEKIKENFMSSLNLFASVMLPIMAQIIIWLREGKKALLNNIELNDMFQFESGILKVHNGFDLDGSILSHIASKLLLNPSKDEDLLIEFHKLSKPYVNCGFIRGKYLRWFLVEFLLHTHKNITEILNRFTTVPKARMSLGHANAVVAIAPRMRCPQSLLEFFQRTYCKYIKEVAL